MVSIFGAFSSVNDVPSAWMNDVTDTLDDSIGEAGSESTDRLSQGSTNLYYTNGRVNNIIRDGNQITWNYIIDTSLTPTISENNSVPLSRFANGTSTYIIVASSGGVAIWRQVTGDITISNTGVITVVDDSHIHDGRYYTETEEDVIWNGKKNDYSNNTGHNKNLGSINGTVSEGDHIHNENDVSGEINFHCRELKFIVSDGAIDRGVSNEIRKIYMPTGTPGGTVYFFIPYMPFIGKKIDHVYIRARIKACPIDCDSPFQPEVALYGARDDNLTNDTILSEDFSGTLVNTGWVTLDRDASSSPQDPNTITHGMVVRLRNDEVTTNSEIHFSSITISYTTG